MMGTITTITSTKDERIVISGSKAGDVAVWCYGGGDGPAGWQVRRHMCDHEAMIAFIYIAEEMNMYLTSGYDGCANLYSLFNDRHFRTFVHPSLLPVHSAVLSLTPLPSIHFYSREDHTWYAYALNEPKRMLDKQREEASHIICPLVVRDSYGMDKLVYGTEKGYLVFRSLPGLKQVKRQ